MASVFEQLLDVQELDTSIDQLQHRRAHLPERAELTALAGAESELSRRTEDVDRQAAELGRSQKRFEDEIALVEARRVEVDQKMYSGSVTSPRELQAMQDEVESLGRRTSELEDELLEVLTLLEPVEEARTALEVEGQELSSRKTEIEARLTQAEVEIDAELGEVEGQRKEAANLVAPDRLAEYERRRPQLGGIAVARLRGNSCGGCHLTLSAVEIDRIRKLDPNEPVTCEECGRMLVR